MPRTQQLTTLATLYGGLVEVLQTPRGGYRVKVGNNDPEEWTRVTGITGAIAKQDVLVPWAVGLAATHMRQFIETNDGPFTVDQLTPIIAEAESKHRRAKEEAADFGTAVHDYAETFGIAKIAGTALPEIPKDAPQAVLNGIGAFLDWVTVHDVKFLATERVIASVQHEYVGKLDLIASVNGVPLLVDYKTSKAVYDDMWLQVAGYYAAIDEEREAVIKDGKAWDLPELEGRLILNFSKETGEFTAHQEPVGRLVEDIDTFLATNSLKKWIDARRKEYEARKKA